MEQVIEIPADTKMVTLELKKHCSFTLRSLLPQIKGDVELVIEDEFGTGMNSDADLYRLKANSGDSLLRRLARSRVVDGESLLDLTPSVQRQDPQVGFYAGTSQILSGTGCIQLWVYPYARAGQED